MKKMTQEERRMVEDLCSKHLEEMLEIVKKFWKKTCNQEDLVTKYLIEMRMPYRLKGFEYIRNALCICIEDPNMLKGITKKLYPEIAKKFDTTPARVERNIRHAIKVTWDRGKKDMIEECMKSKKGKATNSEFLALLTHKIRKELS